MARSSKPSPRPATTTEGREHQLIAIAMDLAEKQMREGTASAQVISHYLKLGSTREQEERRRLATENELLRAKTEQLASAKRVEDLMVEALAAMRSYSGQTDEEVADDY